MTKLTVDGFERMFFYSNAGRKATYVKKMPNGISYWVTYKDPCGHAMSDFSRALAFRVVDGKSERLADFRTDKEARAYINSLI